MRQNIKLHIEELILQGFDRSDRFRIGAAVQSELTRLLAEQGVPYSLSQGGEFNRLDGGTFNMAPNSRAEVIGTRTAQRVYGGLDK
jgi:hypothetical protein